MRKKWRETRKKKEENKEKEDDDDDEDDDDNNDEQEERGGGGDTPRARGGRPAARGASSEHKPRGQRSLDPVLNFCLKSCKTFLFPDVSIQTPEEGRDGQRIKVKKKKMCLVVCLFA